jgi:hypothetical protein
MRKGVPSIRPATRHADHLTRGGQHRSPQAGATSGGAKGARAARRLVSIGVLALTLIAAGGLTSAAEARRGHHHWRDYLGHPPIGLPTSWVSPSQSPSASPSPSEPTPTLTDSKPADPTMTSRPSGGFPNASNTGVPSGTVLTDINGDYHARTPGEHVTGKRVKGRVVVEANGVVVEKSEVWNGVYNDDRQASFTVVDTTIGVPNGCAGTTMGDSNYIAIRVYARNVSEGPRDSGDNILVRDSFIKLCSKDPSDHSDGFQGYVGGRNVQVLHNTIDQRGVITAAVNAPVFIADGSKEVILRDNLLMSGTMTIRVYAVAGGRYEVTGNRVVKDTWIYSAVDSDCGSINWSDNWLVTINSDYAVTSTVGALSCR